MIRQKSKILGLTLSFRFLDWKSWILYLKAVRALMHLMGNMQKWIGPSFCTPYVLLLVIRWKYEWDFMSMTYTQSSSKETQPFGHRDHVIMGLLDNIEMTLGRGQWPMDTKKTDRLKLHFFWRRVYLGCCIQHKTCCNPVSHLWNPISP